MDRARDDKPSLAKPSSASPAPDPEQIKLAALRRPASYPDKTGEPDETGEAGETGETGETGSIETIETHMSWVFLTERHAYKLKKPLRTPHIDNSTPELRRRACEDEVRLNRRLAPRVYLGVVPVVTTHGDIRVQDERTPAPHEHGGSGATILDWMVKMRRLPRASMLDARIARGAVNEADIRRLVPILARFYRDAERAGWTGAGYRERLESDITAKCGSLARPRYELPRDLIAAAETRQRQWIAHHRELLDERASAVVDAHGDLRPEHICLGPELSIIDCLEFDRQLRLLDPVSELSFLSLECRRLGAPAIGRWVLESYAELSGDRPRKLLVGFYHAYHAVVRAAVAIWHIDDQRLDRSAIWKARAIDYLRLADQLLRDGDAA